MSGSDRHDNDMASRRNCVTAPDAALAIDIVETFGGK